MRVAAKAPLVPPFAAKSDETTGSNVLLAPLFLCSRRPPPPLCSHLCVAFSNAHASQLPYILLCLTTTTALLSSCYVSWDIITYTSSSPPHPSHGFTFPLIHAVTALVFLLTLAIPYYFITIAPSHDPIYPTELPTLCLEVFRRNKPTFCCEVCRILTSEDAKKARRRGKHGGHHHKAHHKAQDKSEQVPVKGGGSESPRKDPGMRREMVKKSLQMKRFEEDEERKTSVKMAWGEEEEGSNDDGFPTPPHRRQSNRGSRVEPDNLPPRPPPGLHF